MSKKVEEMFYDDLFVLIATGSTVNEACKELALDYRETCDNIIDNEEYSLQYDSARKQRRDMLLHIVNKNAILDRVRTKTTTHKDSQGLVVKDYYCSREYRTKH